MNAKEIQIGDILVNESNPNEMSPDQFNKLCRNIEKTGKYPSLIVAPSNDKYVLIDGHHRLEALRSLKFRSVWCEVWDVPEKQLKLLLATLNRLHGTDDNHKRAILIKDLYNEFGEDSQLLMSLLPESEKSFKALLRVAEQDLSDMEAELDLERELVENQISDLVGPEEAKKMASKYKEQPDDGIPRLTFSFEDYTDYLFVAGYFGEKRPDTYKLINLLRDGQIQQKET